MKTRIVVKSGAETLAVLHSAADLRPEALTAADIERIPHVEAFLERLTGLRYHINLVEKDETCACGHVSWAHWPNGRCGHCACESGAKESRA